MQKTIRQILDFILFSNLFIAFCSAVQVAFTYQILKEKPNLTVISLVFFATLAIYNLSMLLAKPANPESSPFRRVRWIFAHEELIKYLTLLAFIGVLLFGLFLSAASQILLLFLGLLSMAYNLPLIKHRRQKTGLRNVPGIKLFIIALVWSLSTVGLPVLELKSNGAQVMSTNHFMLLLAHRFIFITAITLPFDIRDLYQDKSHSLKTIPVLLGETKAYFLCQVLLILSLLLGISFSLNYNAVAGAILLSTIISAWLIFRSKWEKNEYYYFFFLDGVLILPWVFVQLLQVLSV